MGGGAGLHHGSSPDPCLAGSTGLPDRHVERNFFYFIHQLQFHLLGGQAPHHRGIPGDEAENQDYPGRSAWGSPNALGELFQGLNKCEHISFFFFFFFFLSEDKYCCVHSERILKSHILANAPITHQWELAVRRTGFLENQGLLPFHSGALTNPAGRILKNGIFFLLND